MARKNKDQTQKLKGGAGKNTDFTTITGLSSEDRKHNEYLQKWQKGELSQPQGGTSYKGPFSK